MHAMSPIVIFALALVLSGCQVATLPAPRPADEASARLPAERAVVNFRDVVERVEPVAERVCRDRQPRFNCDFQVVVDTRAGQPPNAFQTIDRAGRPVIGFTVALIAEARNRDELAFVFSHEAAHHIAGHIPQAQQRAAEGALLGVALASALGLDPSAAASARDIGGTIGALGYNSGTLLTGTLQAFGFGPSPNAFDFAFSVTGGDAAGLS